MFIIHTDYVGNHEGAVYFLQKLAHATANFAVPFFFIISGYLFFYGKEKFDDIKKGIRRRAGTLVVPYILWCILFVVQLWIASRFKPLNQDYFEPLHNGEILRFLKRMFFAPLLAFHLWYVRDLIGLVAITPLIWICQRRHPFVFLVIICISCGLLKLIPWLSWPLTWFSFGCYFAFSKKEILEIKNKWLGICLLVVYVVITGILISNGLYTTADKWYSFPVILIGIYGIWNSYDLLKIHHHIPKMLTGQTFFLYCAHVPFLTMVALLIFPLISFNPILCGIGYFTPAIITCAFLVAFSLIWQRLNRHSSISRKLYSTLTGGR